ncbi:MAG: Vitamin B12-binding protein precursor [Syntrophorhabdus sp. PtaU1.Bin058]|nr:MAG: Vitamin B12-binding protein precursor [Syntrophorhabdus sp. PtaU1.Bin058]
MMNHAVRKKISPHLFGFLITLLFFVLLPLCLHAGEQGKKGEPKRIISLGPGITEWLYMLGIEDRIIGVTTYCQKPPRAKEKTKIGTVMEVDVEKIIDMRPDLVIGTALTDTKDVRKLRDLGINVIVFEVSKDFNKLCEVFLNLGKLTGREEKAYGLIEASKKRLAGIRKRVDTLPRSRVFVQLGSKPLFAATKDFLINDFIEFAGGANIFRDAQSGLIGREEVVKRNPDVIIITTMGLSGEGERKAWQRYKTVNAVKNGNVYIMDSDLICSPTPVSFVETLEEFVRILHPEAAKG